MKTIKILIYTSFIAFTFSCKDNSFSVHNATLEIGDSGKLIKDTQEIIVDLSKAINEGIKVPINTNGTQSYFKFKFDLKNELNKTKNFYYKIYYQNESYKFDNKNELGTENFYGSWEDPGIGFKTVNAISPGAVVTIEDSLCIVGNPRNESIYYGSPISNINISDSLIQSKKNVILANADWMNSIKEKARSNKISEEEQLKNDALWLIYNELNENKSFNHRWKRNPRMGIYKFYLVICTELRQKQVPDDVKYINKTNSWGMFTNPLGYFNESLHGNKGGVIVHTFKESIKLVAKFNMTNGVYFNELTSTNAKMDSLCFNLHCGKSDDLFKNAQFEQYFHNIDRNFQYNNIDITANVSDNEFRANEYLIYSKQSNSKRFKSFPSNSTCPCSTLNIDSVSKSIHMKNSGYETSGKKVKENVGIRSRLGFTYGKYIAKVKFPRLINKDNVWNGLTCAFWLLSQDPDQTWNLRRACNAKVGYLEKSLPDNQESMKLSKPRITYSEIDFEILKESQYWPEVTYKSSNTDYRKEDASKNHDIIIACTNWDMACQQPEDFHYGVWDYFVNEKHYITQRWNPWYKAITSKVPVDHTVAFEKDYYYYCIEWYPDRIVWKVGPERDQLETICVMNDKMTSIPNNQMQILFTQEWHHEDWWPTAPFKQNNIPFPKNDLKGEIMELYVE